MSLVLVALIVGCGEDGADGGTGEFQDEANAICAERQRAIAVARDDGNQLRGDAAALAAEVKALRQLDPPADAARDYRKMVAFFEDYARVYRQAASAVPDPSQLLSEANQHGAQGRRIARDLGLDVCSEHVY